uniref:Uncharacterized protein n=1 Tax=Steinernema glaseri TaxID=37863 RepID=A0A1I7Y8D2_9BILA
MDRAGLRERDVSNNKNTCFFGYFLVYRCRRAMFAEGFISFANSILPNLNEFLLIIKRLHPKSATRSASCSVGVWLPKKLDSGYCFENSPCVLSSVSEFLWNGGVPWSDRRSVSRLFHESSRKGRNVPWGGNMMSCVMNTTGLIVGHCRDEQI